MKVRFLIGFVNPAISFAFADFSFAQDLAKSRSL
jgi:hypothetical protein